MLINTLPARAAGRSTIRVPNWRSGTPENKARQSQFVVVAIRYAVRRSDTRFGTVLGHQSSLRQKLLIFRTNFVDLEAIDHRARCVIRNRGKAQGHAEDPGNN